jgi:hypothetical protein
MGSTKFKTLCIFADYNQKCRAYLEKFKVNEAMNIPDPERAARIQFLKERVRKGTYKVDAAKVAQSMLRNLVGFIINQDNIFPSQIKMTLAPTSLFFHKSQNHK